MGSESPGPLTCVLVSDLSLRSARISVRASACLDLLSRPPTAVVLVRELTLGPGSALGSVLALVKILSVQANYFTLRTFLTSEKVFLGRGRVNFSRAVPSR